MFTIATLSISFGVKPHVLRTIMQRILMQKGWRAVLIRMSCLAAIWMVVAFVFATEFYLSARSDPIQISWWVAVCSAFRDWFPWILLSPLAVLLAGQFRFDRDTWRRSLVVHVAACALFTLAYQGLLMLAHPAPFFLSAGGVAGFGAEAPETVSPGPGRIGIFAQSTPLELSPVSNGVVVFERGGVIGRATASPPGDLDTVFVAHTNETADFRGPVTGVSTGFHLEFQRFRTVSKWVSFLHIAVLKTQFTVPIYLCIVCVCWVIGHFQESGERERRTLELESRLTQANLQTLKMQLQPHFLFNTLNSISSLVHENPDAADGMIGSLSEFLRSTLEVSGSNEVPLRKELDFVDRYLEIQETRFGDRLRVCREIDPTATDALVPPLILQPLVENAIRHGVESRETGGTVILFAWREGAVLHLEICDDGEGLGGQMLRAGNGIGLSNTKARLQELYGDQHRFVIAARDPTGVRVKIEIPFHLSRENVELHA